MIILCRRAEHGLLPLPGPSELDLIQMMAIKCVTIIRATGSELS